MFDHAGHYERTTEDSRNAKTAVDNLRRVFTEVLADTPFRLPKIVTSGGGANIDEDDQRYFVRDVVHANNVSSTKKEEILKLLVPKGFGSSFKE